MFTPAYAATMAAYNAELNRRVYAAAAALPDEGLRRDEGAFWGSVHGTLSRLLWADHMWMSRLAGWPAPGVKLASSGEYVGHLEALSAARVETDARIGEWAGSVTSEWLAGTLVWFSGATQREQTRPRALVVVHLFNHQTHHRGGGKGGALSAVTLWEAGCRPCLRLDARLVEMNASARSGAKLRSKHATSLSSREETAMSYRVTGLDPAPFRHLYGQPDEALAARNARRYVANGKPGFPDRIELRDAEPGETLLLVNYAHQPARTPYRASHAIFVLEGAEAAYSAVGEIPEPIRIRPISLRAFNAAGEMVDADLVPGIELEPLIARFFANPEVAYLHAHYAKCGCYAARVDRA